jgi:hypothetical protein
LVAVAMTALYDAVLFDRDGTLVVDVPYNGDPALVEPMPGARAALDRLRAAGAAARRRDQPERAGPRPVRSGPAGRRERPASEDLLGPFDTWQVCPHDDGDGCRCRKPAPGLVERAAAALGTTPARCVVGRRHRPRHDRRGRPPARPASWCPPRSPGRTRWPAAPAVAPDLTAAADLILQREALGDRRTPAGPGRHRPGCPVRLGR